jgi:hypothetical protein
MSYEHPFTEGHPFDRRFGPRKANKKCDTPGCKKLHLNRKDNFCNNCRRTKRWIRREEWKMYLAEERDKEQEYAEGCIDLQDTNDPYWNHARFNRECMRNYYCSYNTYFEDMESTKRSIRVDRVMDKLTHFEFERIFRNAFKKKKEERERRRLARKESGWEPDIDPYDCPGVGCPGCCECYGMYRSDSD